MNILWIILALLLFSIATLADVNGNRCGGPLVKSRLKTLGIVKEKASPVLIQKSIELLSTAALGQYKLVFSDMSKTEKNLVEKMLKMPPPVIHRLPFSKLKNVITSGGLVASREAERRNLVMGKPFTPVLEDELFGGHDCVFVTVGPSVGREKYGDVIIHFKKSILKNSWASPWSG